MIELTYTSFFILYLGLALSTVLGVWIYSHYKLRNRTFLPPEKSLYLCEYCHFAYVEYDKQVPNRCPQCGLYNKHNIYPTTHTYTKSHDNKNSSSQAQKCDPIKEESRGR